MRRRTKRRLCFPRIHHNGVYLRVRTFEMGQANMIYDPSRFGRVDYTEPTDGLWGHGYLSVRPAGIPNSNFLSRGFGRSRCPFHILRREFWLTVVVADTRCTTG